MPGGVCVGGSPCQPSILRATSHRVGSICVFASGMVTTRQVTPPDDRTLHPCAHRQVCPFCFVLSITWSRRGTVRPCSGADHRYGAAQTAGHPYRGGKSAFQRGSFILLMPDMFFHHILFHALSLHYVLTIGNKYAVHLRPQANILHDWASGTLILHLPQDLHGFQTVQWVVLQIVQCVVETCMLGHVLIHIFCLDLEEEAVHVSVEELAVFTILAFILL